MNTRVLEPAEPEREDSEENPSDAVLEDAKKRVGATLRGKWKLERIIGVGGMGAVYEARHRNGMRGAVKVLDASLARARDCRERFLREGRLANEVDHVGAVRVLDDDETEDGAAFLVMELLNGSTLDRIAMLRGGVIPADELARYAAQVLDTLIAAHARGIVHRDIKPENLFLTSEGIVKVLDFGIARMNGLGGDSTRVTFAGEPIGTPAFMSPEQARGHWEEVDERTDVYSLGATMFNLTTGEPVHADATSVAELIATVISKPAPPVRQAGEVPEVLAAVIDTATSFDKNARYATAAEMRAALEEAYVALTGEPIPETPVPAPLPPLPATSTARRRRFFRSRRVRQVAIVAIPATIAAACLIVVGTRAAEPSPSRTEVGVVEPAIWVTSATPAPTSAAAFDEPAREAPARAESETKQAPVAAAVVPRIERPASPPQPEQAEEDRASPPRPRVSWMSRRNPLYDRRF